MPVRDDDFDDRTIPCADEIERVVKRALRHFGLPVGDSEEASPPPGDPHPFASAGTKLKDLRAQSGWTIEELAERTGMHLNVLTAFEDGDSAAAGELTRIDLERLAAACCGTLTDLLGPEHPWVRTAPDSAFRTSSGCMIDPWG